LCVVSTSFGVLASTFAYADEAPQWSGFYFGGGVAGSHLNTDQYSPAQLGAPGYQAANYGGGHFYGFLQAGADLQWGNTVLGVRLRHEMTGSNGDSFLKVDEVVSSNAKAITTLSARVGYLLQPQLLVYANAGPAFGRFEYSSVDERWGLVDDKLTANRIGIAAGIGAEYRISEHLSVFAEYNHTSFSRKSSTFDYGNAYPQKWTYNFKHQIDSAQVGMNIRF